MWKFLFRKNTSISPRNTHPLKLMKLSLFTFAAPIFVACNFSAHAATTASVSQMFNFPFTFSDVTTSTNPQKVYFPNSGNYQATVIPFNTNLGTLNSVDVNWNWGVNFSGETGGGSGGSVGLEMQGNTYLAGSGYGGNGTGGGGGASPNAPFSAVAAQVSVNKNFTAAGAGISYDPAIWAALSGNSSYAAKLALGNSAQTYTNIKKGNFTSNADLVVTYNYTAVAVPEPSAGVLLGLGVLGLAARRRRTA